MDLNKSTMKKILFLALVIILMLVGIQNIASIGNWLLRILDIFMPFIIGACIAFVFNVPMSAIEKHILKKDFKGKRAVSYILTLILILGLLAAAVSIIIPKLVETAKSIASDFSLSQIETLRDALVDKFPVLEKPLARFDVSYEAIVGYVTKIFSGEISLFGSNTNTSTILNSTVSAVGSVVSGIATFFIGFAFSVYVLVRKEALGVQGRKVIYSLFKEKTGDQILKVCNLSYTTFANFIKGQFLEACILGLMFFVTMTIFRFPYALLIAVLITVTALIPIFGAFIGCAVGFLLILIVDVKQAFLFVVLFLILQQIEGKLIYPHVVGSSVGLPSVWVLMAITVGGELMGVAGMLIFVPLCSVLYALFREFILTRLSKKDVPSEKYDTPYSEWHEKPELETDPEELLEE